MDVKYTKGQSRGLLFVVKGRFELIIVLTGTGIDVKRSFPNLNFKINGASYTFTRQMIKDLFGNPKLQGWCYGCKISSSGEMRIRLPLYFNIPRRSGTKPDMKAYFVKWIDIDSHQRLRTVTMNKNMSLIVEFSVR